MAFIKGKVGEWIIDKLVRMDGELRMDNGEWIIEKLVRMDGELRIYFS